MDLLEAVSAVQKCSHMSHMSAKLDALAETILTSVKMSVVRKAVAWNIFLRVPIELLHHPAKIL